MPGEVDGLAVVVADEIFIAYGVEETHLQLFISLLTVVFLPDAPAREHTSRPALNPR